jgi:UDPglucose--hexose-1-phosphate uridylyltransferase
MNIIKELGQSPHRRLNALTREWVLVSPHRTQRPWQGQVERAGAVERKPYDPTCYLCPGNSRAGGHRNPQYTSTFVFDNDYAALLPDTPERNVDDAGLIVAASERGICRVICFLPEHDLTLARMQPADIRRVIDVWAEQYLEIGARDFIRHVQIFENRGEMMGASNPHPHCQIWATSTIPNEPAKEFASQTEWRQSRGSCLLCEYLRLELDSRERLVCENDHFAVVVPFWAVWPFETLLLPKRHLASLDEARSAERDALADILKRITTRYDNVFESPFPYSMGFHQKPTDGEQHPEWHLHAHFYPPLLRSATVRKFMVGFEMLGTPQRDITPESAAERLRSTSEQHFTERS